MKTVRALIGVLFIVAVIYGTWLFVPPYFSNYKLQDAISDEARTNTYTPKSENDMRETIYKKAQDMDIPLTREQIQVQRSGNSVIINVDYVVHLNLPGYPLDLKFHDSSQNKAY